MQAKETLMKKVAVLFSLLLVTSTSVAQTSLVPCELESVKAALTSIISGWNIDALPIGTSFKATKVTMKPGSEGKQGTFTNIVNLEIFENGRGSTLITSVNVDAQLYTGGSCQILRAY